MATKNLLYNVVVEVWNNGIKEEFARCGCESHKSKRSAGQCARYLVPKVKAAFPGKSVTVQTRKLTSKIKNLEIAGHKWNLNQGEDHSKDSVEFSKKAQETKRQKEEFMNELFWEKYKSKKSFEGEFGVGESEEGESGDGEDHNPWLQAMKDEAFAQSIQEMMDKAAEKAAKPKTIKIELPEITIEPSEDEIQHPQYGRLARWLAGNVTRIWIFGPAGTGKTYAATQIASALDYPYYMQPRVADEYQFAGFKDAHGNYHPTQVYRWATDPNPKAILILDEVDRNLDVVNVWLNAMLANGEAVFPEGAFKIAETKIVIATANTIGNGNSLAYSAAQSQDNALLDRFSLKLPWDLDDASEKFIAQAKFPYDSTLNVVKLSQKIRLALHYFGIDLEWGPRRTYAMVEAVTSGETFKDAAHFAGLNDLVFDGDTSRRDKVLNQCDKL